MIIFPLLIHAAICGLIFGAWPSAYTLAFYFATLGLLLHRVYMVQAYHCSGWCTFCKHKAECKETKQDAKELEIYAGLSHIGKKFGYTLSESDGSWFFTKEEFTNKLKDPIYKKRKRVILVNNTEHKAIAYYTDDLLKDGFTKDEIKLVYMAQRVIDKK